MVERDAMIKTEKTESWVVYLKRFHKHPDGMNAVCEQSEWEEMERNQPGYHKIVRSGITTEAEAEKLARGTSGDVRVSGYKRKVS